MAIDLEKFRGTLPYSAELFGVYQPLLGWKAKRASLRVEFEQIRLSRAVLFAIKASAPRFSDLVVDPRIVDPETIFHTSTHPLFQTTTSTRRVREAALAFQARNNRLPNDGEWPQVLESADLERVVEEAAADGRRVVSDNGTRSATAVALKAGPSVKDEAVTAGALQWWANNTPGSLASLLGLSMASVPWLLGVAADPLAQFDPETGQAVLSPVGLITLFREYFFEFETFLGPPVGHVWVSPGGSLEVYEVHTRRTKQERETEISIQTMSRSETEVIEEDELSTAVSSENSRDITLGVTAQVGADFGVVEASGSVSFGMGFNTKSAQEHAHRRARKQSERVSNEIRRNFRTVFRTSVETEDTSSRRYVLQNTTDKLVNYELRRKMRQVGVQVQHLGTQLCWQTYLDNPGWPVGLGMLVHVAQPEDTTPDTPPPEAPAKLPNKRSSWVWEFPFTPLDESAMNDGEDELYIDGFDQGADDPGHIKYISDPIVPPPPEGSSDYVLNAVVITRFEGTTPDEDPPEVQAQAIQQPADPPNSFRIQMPIVNYYDNAAIRFYLELEWEAPPIPADAQKIYDERMADYTLASSRAAHATYIKAVRERIKLAGSVLKRPSSDLREEERTIIYRRLIRELTEVDTGDNHLTAELIRAIFDVDKMLYYVAPEWWMPNLISSNRQRFGLNGAKPEEHLTADDELSWGGTGWFDLRPNYLITEESEPAPLGASLGWLIQLDGDEHRNSFLNSPWVKAVIPIRPGKEKAALNWLKLAHVEGTGGLDAEYAGPEPELADLTLEQALEKLATQVTDLGVDIENVLATETVFESGFDPLEDGFRATGEPFTVFDQWIEVLPTDQVVAVDYDANAAMGGET